MDLEDLFFNQQEKDMGCVWPVEDPVTGKRNKFCGEKTLLDANGNKMAFCSAHKKHAGEKMRSKIGKNYNPSKDLKTSFRIGGIKQNG